MWLCAAYVVRSLFAGRLQHCVLKIFRDWGFEFPMSRQRHLPGMQHLPLDI